MKYLFGNWKMSANKQVLDDFAKGLSKIKFKKGVVCGVAIPNVYFQDASKPFEKYQLLLGSQNVSYAESGAYTGETSVKMLVEKQIDFCLVGHSERRTLFKEQNEEINKKINLLQQNSITPVLCVGETLEEYETKQTKKVLLKQLKQGLKGIEKINCISVAYEPVWAIGTGKVATGDDINSAITYIKQALTKMYPTKKISVPVLYGGSVKASNAKQIFEIKCVDGVLVGGASLKCEQFFDILKFM